MSGIRTLQFFADVVLRSVSEADAEALLSDQAETVTLVESVTAITPTNGQRRTEMARFRGSFADYAKARAPREYPAYAIPKGTVLVPAVGSEGVTVAGNAAFFAVPEAILAEKANELGSGTSAEISAAMELWRAKHEG